MSMVRAQRRPCVPPLACAIRRGAPARCASARLLPSGPGVPLRAPTSLCARIQDGSLADCSSSEGLRSSLVASVRDDTD
jgi:hypothetical protein